MSKVIDFFNEAKKRKKKASRMIPFAQDPATVGRASDEQISIDKVIESYVKIADILEELHEFEVEQRQFNERVARALALIYDELMRRKK